MVLSFFGVILSGFFVWYNIMLRNNGWVWDVKKNKKVLLIGLIVLIISAIIFLGLLLM